MKITVEDRMRLSDIVRRVESDELWLFGAHEWRRLLAPYVPRRDGRLMQDVTVEPNTVTYKAPYAHYMYNGKVYVDPDYKKGGFTSDGGITFWSRPGVRKKRTSRDLRIRRDMNPKASKEWDKAAIKDKQDEKLAEAIARRLDMMLNREE